MTFYKYIDEKIESCQFPFLNIPLKLLKIPYKHPFKSSNKILARIKVIPFVWLRIKKVFLTSQSVTSKITYNQLQSATIFQL